MVLAFNCSCSVDLEIDTNWDLTSDLTDLAQSRVRRTHQVFFIRKVEDFDELDDVGVRDEVEDGDLALDHVLLAGALRLVDDLQRERLLGAFAHATVHNSKVSCVKRMVNHETSNNNNSVTIMILKTSRLNTGRFLLQVAYLSQISGSTNI